MIKRFSFITIIALLLAACSGPSSEPLDPADGVLRLELPQLEAGYDELRLAYLEDSSCSAPTQIIPLSRATDFAYADLDDLDPACDPSRLNPSTLFDGTIDTMNPTEAYGIFFIRLFIAGASQEETYVVINPASGAAQPAYLAYVDRDVEITGTLNDKQYNLDLQAGWNLVYPIYDMVNYTGLVTFRSLTEVDLENMRLEPQTGMFG